MSAWLCAIFSWLVAGTLGCALGAALSALATRLRKPALRTTLTVVGFLLIAPATALAAYVAGDYAWDWFHPRCDQEAYLWLIFLTSWLPALAGPLAGASLGRRWGEAWTHRIANDANGDRESREL